MTAAKSPLSTAFVHFRFFGMPKKSKGKGPFEKVGSCLYRYKASGVYYARIKRNGKEIRQRPETTDREAAKAASRKTQRAQQEVLQVV
jgi:hypothetical protein